ncbi:hypothetical protein [Rosistilla oblonga]|uniref:Uncharacterized protein n=1 Tax=Rosistilla oblonga TaxID=2527990 RepID=A0A518ITR9_9BACT|nr:hypothetical protein [Rosistilla oblonga]QDV56481.1 hypothetical protein Mal33_24710 [Rosistilla oblonga]
MQVTMESTDVKLDIDGVPCRLWNGVTPGGVTCLVMVHRIGVHAFDDDSEFSELEPRPGKLTCVDYELLRAVLETAESDTAVMRGFDQQVITDLREILQR